LEVLEKISGGKESGGLSVSVEPVVVIYNTLIDGLCKVGRQAEGLGLMERTRLQKGCSPDTITYHCLINGLCKAGEEQKGKELFDEMNKERVAPNVVTIDTLVGGMCRTWRVGRVV
jgi:pentatricopeptide repeat protein